MPADARSGGLARLVSKVIFPQLGCAPLFIVRWWLPRDSYCSTCEGDDQPTINILVC
jgi:hypothetical protein